MKYAVNCSIMFTELPLLERPAAARAAGFDGVEFWWPFPEATPPDAEVDAFIEAVRQAGVQLVGQNFFSGTAADDKGLLSLPDRSSEFRANVPVVARVGRELGCLKFNAPYGNRIAGVSPDEQDALAVENLAFAAQAVGTFGGTVLLEPLSGSPAYPLRTAYDALAVIDRVEAETGVTNIGLLCDLYHLAVNGDDLDLVTGELVPRIAHVQIADAPGRGEPGSGELPLAELLGRLADGGYDGWVSVEHIPTGATLDSFGSLPVLP